MRGRRVGTVENMGVTSDLGGDLEMPLVGYWDGGRLSELKI